jgi:uncharacterized protein YjdB
MGIAVTEITLDKTSLALVAGDTEKLTATVAPANANNKTVTWTSSNNAVATVSGDGTVTAAANGTAAITATAGGKTATCTVTVSLPVAITGISLSETSLTLCRYAGHTLTATVAPANATNKNITWTSSNNNVYRKLRF